jgi:hypothetical protein
VVVSVKLGPGHVLSRFAGTRSVDVTEIKVSQACADTVKESVIEDKLIVRARH